ncbi:hypothetical protein NW762_010123 [Fusarium torreyae]|uniref:Uncharacterized protein n=1 Tax=Fusarium torreyae TaxID=1237075 RepID=A0A9W8RUA1_9HYPO|nr:hypothetical protein NW762_010123 [Fusarium torreyae]
MHQSVRDFICNSGTTGALHFTLQEATSLVRRHLDHYSRLLIAGDCRMSREGPHEPEFVINWLNDQKLRQLVTFLQLQERDYSPPSDANSIVNWKFQDPTPDSQDALLTEAIQLSNRFKEKVGPQGDTCQGILDLGRILYHACAEGLVTAVQNIILMISRWEHSPASMRIICACVVFAASRCPSPRLRVDFYAGKTTQQSSAEERRQAMNPDTNTDSDDESMDIWVSVPWNVILSLDKKSSFGEFVVHFTEWCYYLDLVCGSKSRHARSIKTSMEWSNGEVHEDSDDIDWATVAAHEDVEDAVNTFCLRIRETDMSAETMRVFIR